MVEIDPLGRITSRELDWRGNVLSVIQAEGTADEITIEYSHDDAGNLVSVVDGLGRTTSLGYDNLNRRISVTLDDPDSGGPLSAPVYLTGYNKLNTVVSQTDPLGNVTTTAVDNLQRVISVTGADPDGGGGLAAPVTQYIYGSHTMLTEIVDPLGHSITLGYDDWRRNNTVTNELGYVTTTTFNNLDQPLTVTTPDPDGAGGLSASVTTTTYDFLNRPATVVDAASGVTTFGYNLNNELISLDDPVGNTTTYTRDNLGRVIEEENELSYSRYFVYDAASNLTRKKDRENRVTAYSHDELNRLTSELWLASASTMPSLAIATTTQGGAVSEVQRVGLSDTMYLMGGTFTLSFGGQTTSGIAYNASAATVETALAALSSIGTGNVSVSKSIDAMATQEWTVTFQGALAGADQSQVTVNSGSVSHMGTLTNIQATDTTGGLYSEVQTVTLSNATAGTFRLAFGNESTGPIAYNASASTVQTGLTALSTIDTGNVSVSGSAGGPWTVTFQGSKANTNVAAIQGDASHTQSGSVSRSIAYETDLASQLLSASDVDGELEFTYDALGRTTSASQTITGLTPEVVLSQTFDAASNRLSLSATIGGAADFKNDYTFDNLSRQTRVVQQGQSGGNTVAAKRADSVYNAGGQVTTLDRYQSTGTSNFVATTSFSFDALNRATGLNHDQGATTLNHYSLSYDNVHRPTSISSTTEGASSFSYDVTSQLTAATHAGQANEAYGFDANGNRNTTGYTTATNNRTTSDGTYNYEHDHEGNRTKRTNIATGDYEEYTWDHRNRLTKVTFKNSSGTVLKTVEQFYDVLNRWTRRTTDPDGPGAATAVDTFFSGYDGINPTLQFDGGSASDLTNRYLWDEGVDQLFADEQVTSLSQAGNPLWAAADHLATIRDILDLNESTGVTSVANHRTYNSFGLLVSQSNASTTIIFGHHGKPLDTETGQQNHWQRWYDTRLGEWTNEDPITFRAGDTNLDRAFKNRPTQNTDPSGLFIPGVSFIGGAIGAAYGAGIGVGVTVGVSVLATGHLPSRGQVVGAAVGGAVAGAITGAIVTGDVAGAVVVGVAAGAVGCAAYSATQQSIDHGRVNGNIVMRDAAFGGITGGLTSGVLAAFPTIMPPPPGALGSLVVTSGGGLTVATARSGVAAATGQLTPTLVLANSANIGVVAVVSGEGSASSGGSNGNNNDNEQSGRGRRGSPETRDQLDEVRDDFLERNPDYEHVFGGRDQLTGAPRPEEYLPPLDGGRRGGSYPDLTFQGPNAERVRINTVDTRADGTLTPREQAAFERIFEQTGEPIIVLPK